MDATPSHPEPRPSSPDPAGAPDPGNPPATGPVPDPAGTWAAGSPALRTAPFLPGPPAPFLPGTPASFARRVAAPLGAIAAVAAAFAYVGNVDPNEAGHYPVCPLLRFTGILCPGCGGLRSAHAFIHGDLAGAFGANAAATVGYAVFAVVWVVWLIRAVQNRPLRIGLSPGAWWVVGGALLIFSVVRNLPFGSALAP
ncbi:DUF2752 domain-containing protein [Streptomyces sp. NPDC003023]|uniref:DUF2752 domain-containing protein n=1 Tax=Streptomyces sp. NPDC003023 TaxID=3364675 RepID=UPI00367D3F31